MNSGVEKVCQDMVGVTFEDGENEFVYDGKAGSERAEGGAVHRIRTVEAVGGRD
jgi:hypothetical protein